MRRLLALLLLASVLLGVLWLALWRGTPAAPAGSAPSSASGHAASVELVGVEPFATDPAASRVEVAPEAEGDRSAVATSGERDPRLAELRGRFLLEGGAPAVGTKVQFRGSSGNSQRLMKHGKPEDWKNLEAVCDSGGRFVVRFDPPRAYQFFLDASYAGCVTARWRWHELEPGSTTDLGDVVLVRGGVVTGRVLDAEGRSTRVGWMVYAQARATTGGEGGDSPRVMGSADPETGEFRLEAVPSGPVELTAYSKIANWIEGPQVEVRAGETVEADICYSGPDNSRRIVVSTSTRPFHSFSYDVGEIRLEGPGLEPRLARHVEGSSQSFAFDDVPPGSYSITIHDPKFEPWRQDGVSPGQAVDAKLVGPCSVRLSVRDAATDAVVERFGLRVRFERVSFFPKLFEVFGADAEPPPGGVVEGLIPVDQTLIVLADGYSPCELPLAGLQPGESRSLVAELRPGTSVVARVLEADGTTPAPGLEVVLEGNRPSEPGATRIVSADDPSRLEATTGADGRASFPAVTAGSYTLRAERTPLVQARIEDLSIADSDTERVVDLVLPASGWLVGRLLGFDQDPAEGCTVVVLPTALAPEERARLGFPLLRGPESDPNAVALDGSFRAGPLVAGRCTVQVRYPTVMVRQNASSSWGLPGPTIELGEVEIPPGGELRRDFDVRGRLPGAIDVIVRLEGARALDAYVLVLAADPSAERGRGVIELDGEGRGRSGPIAPGRVTLAVQARDDSWSWSLPEARTVVSRETLSVALDISLAGGKLQLVDAVSGAPLADRRVMLRRATGSGELPIWLSTNGEGRLEPRLVPAAYQVFVMGEAGSDGRVELAPYESPTFDWTASGPAEAVLKVERKP